MVDSKMFEGMGELLQWIETNPAKYLPTRAFRETVQLPASSWDYLMGRRSVEVESIKEKEADSRKQTSEWNVVSWKEAIRLAREGWEEGTKLVEKFSSMFIDRLGSQLQIDEYFYDVSGQDFDLDRVLIGEPEAWLNTEQVEVKAPALHTLKLVVNINANASTSANVMLTKGAAIVALVSLLEKCRRSVEVWVIARNENKATGGGFNFDLLLKEAGQNIDLAKLAFAIAHPAMLRRIQFAVMEGAWKELPWAYGVPSDERKPEADIYIGRASAWENHCFSSEKGTEKWIMEELKKQGIELRGA